MTNCPVLSIDVSKSKSFAAPFIAYGQPFLKPFSFSHTTDGIKGVSNCLRELELQTGQRPRVILEATGNYSKPLHAFFVEAGYEVTVLNPLETHIQKKKSVRKVKTDPIDTNRIAQVYYLNPHRASYLFEPHIEELRTLCRQYDSFNSLYVETQNRFRAVLDLLFPGFETTFSHLCSPTALRVLSNFPSPASVLAAPRDKLLASLSVAKKSQDWYNSIADKLTIAARESLPFNQAQQSSERVLKNYIEILLSQQKVLADIRAQMIYWASLSPAYTLLLSIPGVGEATATTILAEIGDIKRFPAAKQLVAFAGLDPSVFESGKFKSSNNKISKRGSTYLRKAVYQATVAGISNRKSGVLNPVLNDFYRRKLSEGKRPKVAIIATANKLLRIIFGILSSNQVFMAR